MPHRPESPLEQLKHTSSSSFGSFSDSGRSDSDPVASSPLRYKSTTPASLLYLQLAAHGSSSSLQSFDQFHTSAPFDDFSSLDLSAFPTPPDNRYAMVMYADKLEQDSAGPAPSVKLGASQTAHKHAAPPLRTEPRIQRNSGWSDPSDPSVQQAAADNHDQRRGQRQEKHQDGRRGQQQLQTSDGMPHNRVAKSAIRPLDAYDLQSLQSAMEDVVKQMRNSERNSCMNAFSGYGNAPIGFPNAPGQDFPGNHGGDQITNVYINGLAPTTTDDDLLRLGMRCGGVISHKAIIDATTGMCKGYGFLMYENAHEAANAIKSLAFQGYQTSYAKESFSAKLRRMADRSSTNVYISNLPLNMNVKGLEMLLAPHVVVSMRILTHDDGTSRGVGFVRMRDRDIAQECIDRLHGKMLPGSSLPLQARFADSEAQKRLKQTAPTKVASGRGEESPQAGALEDMNGTAALNALKAQVSVSTSPNLLSSYMLHSPGSSIMTQAPAPAHSQMLATPPLSLPSLSPGSVGSGGFESVPSFSPGPYDVPMSYSPNFDPAMQPMLDQAALRYLQASARQSPYSMSNGIGPHFSFPTMPPAQYVEPKAYEHMMQAKGFLSPLASGAAPPSMYGNTQASPNMHPLHFAAGKFGAPAHLRPAGATPASVPHLQHPISMDKNGVQANNMGLGIVGEPNGTTH